MINIKEIQRKINYFEKRTNQIKKVFERDGQLDKIRTNELNSIEKELEQIKGAVKEKHIIIGVKGEETINSTIKNISEVTGKEPKLLHTEKERAEKVKEEFLKKQEENIIKPKTEISETKVEEIMGKFKVSREFAEKLATNPEKAQEEAKANFEKMMKEKEEEKARLAARKKKIGLHK